VRWDRHSEPQSGVQTSVMATPDAVTPSMVAAISAAITCLMRTSEFTMSSSIPVMRNVPENGTWIASVGDSDGLALGETDGEVDGDTDGSNVGLADGLPDGDTLGLDDGLVDGDALGLALGLVDGDELGEAEGLSDGDALGETLGDALGDEEGTIVGLALGLVDWSEWMNRLPETSSTRDSLSLRLRSCAWRLTSS